MLTHSPGQNPRLASTSPSAARELWFEPIVAPAAILVCTWITAAQRKALLWCCSCAGKSSELSTSQHEMVEWSPKKELVDRAPYLSGEKEDKTNRTALTPLKMRQPW